MPTRALTALCLALAWPSVAAGQQPTPPPHHHVAEQIDLFPSREASGTAWIPDTSPMYGAEFEAGRWRLMVHGNGVLQYLYEPGDVHRTGGEQEHQLGGVNWIMLMARRPMGSGRFGLRAMLSGEPWTITNCGSINFLASGEICEGDTIHDRQHPHDLFMELAADYERPLGGQLRWHLYGGLAGEPALGPAGFPHRPSAMSNPIAPITHHWLDSTHITFGLVTSGISTARWRAEVSAFNAREPDEHRADLDLDALDSISGRISVNATSRLSLQVSAGHLREAEEEFSSQPRSDVTRFTASAIYVKPLGGDGSWATTLAWGANDAVESLPEGTLDAVTHAGLFETTASYSNGNTFFGRAEIAGKPAHDLHAHEYSTRIFTVGKLQAGYVRYLRPWKGMTAGIGATIAASLVPDELASRYNGRVAPGFGFFLTVRPRVHAM